MVGGLRIRPEDLDTVRRLARRALERTRMTLRRQILRLGEPVRADAKAAFVLGCQRSGTTILARALERSPYVDLFHETNVRAFSAVRLRERAVTLELLRQSRARTVIFKSICDSQHARRLLLDHNDSKAIWIHRDMPAVARSAVQYWGDHFALAMRSILVDPRQATWYAEFLPPERLEQIRELCTPNMSAYSGAALFWLLRNQLYFDLALDQEKRVLLVKYEDLIADPRAGLGRILEFLDLPWDDEVLRDIDPARVGDGATLAIEPRIAAACQDLKHRLTLSAAHARKPRSQTHRTRTEHR